MANSRLDRVIADRKVGGKKNRVSSIFAVLIRECKLSKKKKESIKKGFRTDDFIPIPDNELRGAITKWFTKRCTIGAVNHSEDEDANADENKAGNEMSLDERKAFIKDFDISN